MDLDWHYSRQANHIHIQQPTVTEYVERMTNPVGLMLKLGKIQVMFVATNYQKMSNVTFYYQKLQLYKEIEIYQALLW